MSETNQSRFQFFRRLIPKRRVTQQQLQDAISSLRYEMDEIRDEIRDERRYTNGTYYRSLHDIWGHKSVDFQGAAKTWKKYRSKDKSALEYYREGKGRRYYSNEFPRDRLFPSEKKSMAHLIPNDPSCSLAWLRALSIVTGIGVNSESKSPLLDEELRSFVEVNAKNPMHSGDTHVPLKAWAWNFLMLPENHEKHFDKIAYSNDKQLIVSPIWDPEDEWSPSTGYKLMVAASRETYKWLLGTEKLDDESLHKKWYGVASQEDSEKATKFLALTVKALADLLVTNSEDDLTKIVTDHRDQRKIEHDQGATDLEKVFESILGAIPKDLLSQSSFHTNESASTISKISKEPCRIKAEAFAKKVKALENVRDRNLTEKKNVQIPVFQSDNMKPILVIDLGAYFEGKKHLIPDPFLVALKAAASWSSFRDQKLLPACGIHPDHQLGSDAEEEESIPFEIFSGDGNFEAVSTP